MRKSDWAPPLKLTHLPSAVMKRASLPHPGRCTEHGAVELLHKLDAAMRLRHGRKDCRKVQLAPCLPKVGNVQRSFLWAGSLERGRPAQLN